MNQTYSDAMMALHADWCAQCEEETPGLRPVLPPRRETCEQERSRLFLQGERRGRIRSDAAWRLLAQRLAPIQSARRGGHGCGSMDHLTLFFATDADAARAVVLLTGTVEDLRANPADPRSHVRLPSVTGRLNAMGPGRWGTGEPDPIGDFLRAERDAFRGALFGSGSPALPAIAAE